MAAGGFVAQRKQFGMREYEETITVPDHPKARLMYYLYSIAGLLALDDPNISRLKAYNHYHSLSEAETDALLTVVVLFSPDELIGKVMFPSDELCGDSLNNVFELSQAINLIAAVQKTVLIAGECKRVLKIMTFKMRWLEKNYLEPIRTYQNRLQRIASDLRGNAQPRAQRRCVIL